MDPGVLSRRDPDTGAWISDAEVAETTCTAFSSTKTPITARLIVRRVKDARYPDALFPVWRYHPFFTDTDDRPCDNRRVSEMADFTSSWMRLASF